MDFMPTVSFTMRIDADLKKSLEREAKLEDRSASYLAHKAIESLVTTREQKRTAIQEALADADKGVFISEEKMDAWVSAWGTADEGSEPEPDIFPKSNNS